MTKDGVVNQFNPPKFLRRVQSDSDSASENSEDCLCLSEFCSRELLTKKLGPGERRFEVCNVNFRIVGSKYRRQQSLFCAVSQALTGHSADWKLFHDKTYGFMKEAENWGDYYPRIMDTFTSFDGLENRNQIIKSLKERSPGTLIELHAAARRFHFTFSIVFIEGNVDADGVDSKVCDIYTSHDPDVSGWAEGVKYYFIRWGSSQGRNRHWELLQPIGALMDISDGTYTFELKEAFNFPGNPGVFHPSKEYRCPLSLETTLVFTSELREFKYKKTTSADIYSILSEALFQTDKYTEIIKSELEERREKLAYVLHLSPRRKETLEHGMPTTGTYAFAKCPFVNGDPTDVKLAASIFHFSYLIFGLLHGGMGVWDRFLTVNEQEQEDAEDERPWLAFLCQTEHAKTDERSNHQWFLLQESRHFGNKLTSTLETDMDYDTDSLLDPIRPVPSQYHCNPLRPTMESLSSRSWLFGLFSKRSNFPTTLLLPKNFPTYPEEKTQPILRVKSELARQIQFELFHKPGIQESFIAHPDLDYFPVNVSKGKPSTAFPLLARAYCKPIEAMCPTQEEDFIYPPNLYRKSSYSKLRHVLSGGDWLAGSALSVAAAFGRLKTGLLNAGTNVPGLGRAFSGLVVTGVSRAASGLRKSVRSVRNFLERTGTGAVGISRSMSQAVHTKTVQLRRSIASHFEETIR